MIYGFVLMFLVVNLLFFWLDRKIDNESKKRYEVLYELERRIFKIQSILLNLCRDLHITDSSVYTELSNHYYNPFRKTGVNNIPAIEKLYTDIQMLHDYLGVKLEPSKTEPEKLVKVKKEVGK